MTTRTHERATPRAWMARAWLAALLAWSPLCWGLSSKMLIESVFSNADGTVQFIEALDAGLGDCDAGEEFWVGVRLTATGPQPARVHTFTANLPTCRTSHKRVLIASEGFAALGLVQPDFVIPNGFLQIPSGELDLAGAEGMIYANMPLDGEHAINFMGAVVPAVAINLAGQTAPVKVASVPSPATVTAIEYYHAGFDHYFITASADEITKLDNGTFAGWARTGLSFKVYAGDTSAGVCRFFSTAFGPKSSHFYTASAAECTQVQSNPDWQFEGVVLHVALPAADGTCASGTQPVYRLYNNGAGSAPNHRYVASLDTRAQMLAIGWIAEGYGVGVTMCAPA